MMKDELKICGICGEKFKHNYKIKHINEHGISYEEYIIKTLYNGIKPKCECGCGEYTSFYKKSGGRWFARFIPKHVIRKPFSEERKLEIHSKMKITNNKKYGVDYPAQNKNIYSKFKKSMYDRYGVEFTGQSQYLSNKTKETNLKRYGKVSAFQTETFRKKYKTKKSKSELIVCEKLGGVSGFMFKGKEYDIKLGNNLFEIDGDYIHCDKFKNLNIIQLSSCVNDFNKINDCKDSEYNLYKIFISNLPKEITEENLIKNSYIPNFELNYEDIIVSKEYLKKFNLSFNSKRKYRYIAIFLKFLQIFGYSFIKDFNIENIKNSIIHIININENTPILDFSIKNLIEALTNEFKRL